MPRASVPLLSLLLCATAILPAAGPPGKATSRPPAIGTVEFQRDIRPILSNRCFKCHGPGTQQAGVRLDTAESVLKRKIIVPGKPDASRLMHVITAADEARMPPADSDDRLSATEVARLRGWIEQGAVWSPHWAYLPPRRERIPTVKDRSWPNNGVDHFILARLEQAGLRPSPPADRVTLIRRVYLDLLGLLPGPADVAAFVDDTRADAYERLVDRLLASPHHGERQARHWLDLARYADSNGYTIDGQRSIWPYRDWVTNAFNGDLPFDQFTIEQIAGDQLPRATREQLVATGFHRNTPFNEEGGADPEQFRVERTLDRTNTTGTVWLGLTVACAQCHDHKFDAISQKDYYRLYAFFNSIEEPPLALGGPEQDRRLSDLNARLTRARQEQARGRAKKQSPDDMAAELSREARGGWKILTPGELKAEKGSKLTRMRDRSVLASGPTPDSDVYHVQAPAPEGLITAVRLEALTHPNLPRKGPGRAGNGNFVLSHFVLEVDGKSVPFSRAAADHSQNRYDVSQALLGEPKRGWAINVEEGPLNVNRQAVFVLEKPITVKRGTVLTFTLRSSEWPKRYPLGRFRLSVTSAGAAFLDLPIAAQKVLLIDPERRSEEEVDSLREALAQAREQAVSQAKRVQQLQRQIKELQSAIQTTLVVRESARRRPTHVYIRGDFLSKGSAVEAGTLTSLPPLAVKGRPATRLDLARWLVQPENPLTARVVVNRMWQQYFGKGLVETENDFGMQGSMPTHPELLDFLATEFVRRGWSMKQMHRLIVSSATYRQASVQRPEVREKDPNNTLLAQQVRLRLEAEIIRDAALSASGLLSRQLGGPGVYPPQPQEVFSFTQSKKAWPESKGPDRYRRGLYTFIWRQSQHPLLTTFDGADAQTTCTRRNRSNTPLQALHLANNRAFVELAEGLGQRVTREGPADDGGRIDLAFRLCLARSPEPDERDHLLRFLAMQKKLHAEAAWTMVARVLLNLDEFITRE